MNEALIEDQQDIVFKEFSNSKQGWEWQIHNSKVMNSVAVDPIYDKYTNKDHMVKVPFLIGESMMISHAVFACYNKQKSGTSISPITDDSIHRQLFKRRLERGIENVKELKNQFPIPEISNVLIRVPMPHSDSINEILSARKTHSSQIDNIKQCIIRIAEILQNSDDHLKKRVDEVSEKMIEIYQEMGLTNKNSKEALIETGKESPSSSTIIGKDQTAIIGLDVTLPTEFGMKTSRYTPPGVIDHPERLSYGKLFGVY